MKKLIFAIIIFLVVLVSAIFYYMDSFDVEHFDSNSSITGQVTHVPDDYFYNGYEFRKVGNSWQTQIQNNENIYNIELHYSPLEVENIEFDTRSLEAIQPGKEIYFTFDFVREENNSLGHIAVAASEISINIVQTLNMIPVAACFDNVTEECIERPIVTCEGDQNVAFHIRTADKPKILVENNCIIIEGKDEDLFRASASLLYHWYGIMK